MDDKKSTLRAKIEAKKLQRTNKYVKEKKIDKLKEQADKDLKAQFGENYDINNLMSSFMKKL